MLLNKLGFFDKTKLKLASKLFPVRETRILLYDKLELDLARAKINQVIIPAIPSSQITDDFCPTKPSYIDIEPNPDYSKIVSCPNGDCPRKLRLSLDPKKHNRKLFFKCPICKKHFDFVFNKNDLIEDLTFQLTQQLSNPNMEIFPLLSHLPIRAGKSYNKAQVNKSQNTLFDDGKDKTCIHGINKSWCAICVNREKQEKDRPPSYTDTFDLIFPLLLPPLGENFDNPVAFPWGFELYPFQRLGVKFLAEHDRALLGDEMGLGKSIQAIVAIRFLLHMGRIAKGLILCPKSVLT
jgi:hypothetical protein